MQAQQQDPRVVAWSIDTTNDRLLSPEGHSNTSHIRTGGIFLLFVTVSSYAILVFLAGRRRKRMDLSELLQTEDPDGPSTGMPRAALAGNMPREAYHSEFGDDFFVTFFPDSDNGYDARNETFPFMAQDRRKVLGQGKTSLFKTTTPVAIHDDGYETDDTSEKCEIWTKYSRSNSMIRDFGDMEPIV
jgi:hypothetical protein